MGGFEDTFGECIELPDGDAVIISKTGNVYNSKPPRVEQATLRQTLETIMAGEEVLVTHSGDNLFTLVYTGRTAENKLTDMRKLFSELREIPVGSTVYVHEDNTEDFKTIPPSDDIDLLGRIEKLEDPTVVIRHNGLFVTQPLTHQEIKPAAEDSIFEDADDPKLDTIDDISPNIPYGTEFEFKLSLTGRNHRAFHIPKDYLEYIPTEGPFIIQLPLGGKTEPVLVHYRQAQRSHIISQPVSVDEEILNSIDFEPTKGVIISFLEKHPNPKTEVSLKYITKEPLPTYELNIIDEPPPEPPDWEPKNKVWAVNITKESPRRNSFIPLYYRTNKKNLPDPDTPILIEGILSEEETILTRMEKSSSGYVLKQYPKEEVDEELIEALPETTNLEDGALKNFYSTRESVEDWIGVQLQFDYQGFVLVGNTHLPKYKVSVIEPEPGSQPEPTASPPTKKTKPRSKETLNEVIKITLSRKKIKNGELMFEENELLPADGEEFEIKSYKPNREEFVSTVVCKHEREGIYIKRIDRGNFKELYDAYISFHRIDVVKEKIEARLKKEKTGSYRLSFSTVQPDKNDADPRQKYADSIDIIITEDNLSGGVLEIKLNKREKITSESMPPNNEQFRLICEEHNGTETTYIARTYRTTDRKTDRTRTIFLQRTPDEQVDRRKFPDYSPPDKSSGLTGLFTRNNLKKDQEAKLTRQGDAYRLTFQKH